MGYSLSTRRTHKTPGPTKHNLPAHRSSFVGREREIERVEHELASTRLLTLTGAGGAGKTRLALEVARDLLEAYPEGMWLVQLAALSEEALVPKAVAEALGVSERPGEPLLDTLSDVLRERRLLILLDNCEHLLEASAGLVDVLLDSCPHLQIMTTSREPLGVEGEMRWPVPPLSVPEPQHVTPSSGQLEAYESVRLFAERARGRDPSFSLGPQNALAVAEICRRLEGIPLAIELAAARVGTLSVEQVLERLTDSLNLLTGGSRTRLPRQQTLKGTLEWSHELLSEEEKGLFGRLSVFAGGWTLEAAEAVGAAGDAEEEEVLDLLSGLVDKSLVTARERQQSGGVRYRMLEPVRQYALERLNEKGEAEGAKRAHARYFLALAEEAEPRLRGPEEREWLERLEEEHDNMRAALSWTLERGEVEPGLRLAGALWRFWETHGHLGEGRKWLEAALQKDDPASVAWRLKALEAMSSMALAQWDLDRGEAAAQEGLTLCTEAGIGSSPPAPFLTSLGFVAWQRGENERAKELFEDSLTLSREVDDKIRIADALLYLGYASLDSGDRERAKKLFEEGIVLCRNVGYGSRLFNFWHGLGYVLLIEGDYERGTALNEEAAELYRERGYKGGLEFVLDNLGWAALLQGNRERARTSYEEALKLSNELGNKLMVSQSLEGLAYVSAAEGAPERAARLFGAAQALRRTVGIGYRPEEDPIRAPYLAVARSQAGEAAWEEALAHGQAVGLEEAIEYALSAEESSATEQSPPSAPEHPAGLSSREVEVLGLVAEGLTNAQVAERLFVSPRTVHRHLNSVYRKLGVSSRTAATRFAIEHNLA
jgi:predicted ATPase/DNA-binding CsgD family transcriptional regulator